MLSGQQRIDWRFVTTPERRGLGRGLGAIIRDTSAAESLPVASADGAGSGRYADRELVRQLAEVGLDLIDGPELTHLAYLHQVIGGEPQLVLRRPCLAELNPTTAYRLLGGLDRASGDLEHVRYAELDDAALCFVPSRGPHSTGVHLFGSPRPLETARRGHLEQRCRAAAEVVHQLHREIEPTDETIVTIEQRGGEVLARAVLERPGGPRTGEATDPDEASAVARAIVAAHNNGLVHRATRSLVVEGELQAVLTVLAEPSGRPRLGFTVSESSVVDVARSATRRAIEG